MDRNHQHDTDSLEPAAGESTPAQAIAAPVESATRYFQSVEELQDSASLEEAREREIGKPPVADDDLERRDFMKLLGGSFAAIGATACGRLPVHKAVPYVEKPAELTVGQNSYYATVCRGCNAGCGLLVASRDGRPIKVEGNPEHPLSLGGTCAVAQALPYGLYDGDRLRGPMVGGQPTTWDDLFAKVDENFAPFRADGSRLAVVTRPVSGPANRQAISALLGAFPGARHVVYDAGETLTVLDAHQITHGKAVVPDYAFHRADYILSFGADFLGTWLAPVAFTRRWVQTRKLTADHRTMSRHVQVETQMSLTGSNADERVRVLPSEMRALVLGLADRVGRKTGASFGGEAPVTDKGALLDAWADALAAHQGRSIVLSDSDDLAVQTAVNFINQQLGNYGKTLDLDAHLSAFQGSRAAVDELVDQLAAGQLQGVILIDVNPVYTSRRGAEWAAGLGKTAARLSIGTRMDETAQLCNLVAAMDHGLEAWGDDEPIAGLVSVQQPLIRPLFDTRTWTDIALGLAGVQTETYAWMQRVWEAAVLPRAVGDKTGAFQPLWDKAVHDGYLHARPVSIAVRPAGPALAQAPQPATVEPAAAEPATAEPATAEPGAAAALPAEATPAAGLPADATPTAAPVIPLPPIALSEPVAARYDAAGVSRGLGAPAPKVAGQGAFELVTYEKVAIRNGEHANNPFLQELPDPITKATWGNYALLSPTTANKLGVLSSHVVTIQAGGASVRLPVVLAPGLHDGAVAIAKGYGRDPAFGRVAGGLGASVAPVGVVGVVVKVDVSVTGDEEPVAFSQTHHSYEHRDIVRETPLEAWQKDPGAGNFALSPMLRADPDNGRFTRSIWPRHQYPGYKWGMSIDMNACTGCGACVIACNVENNIPVVGKREVLVRREMHWLRIDRYFSEAKKVEGYDWDSTGDALLELAANPEVVHQPMLCQHCENAPCETVCPVLATVHTTEGLNAQVYNRCIGTRYCANNCPYKVRRFNWFNYPTGDMLGKQDLDLVALALNPDVVKRSRGVMEKCTFCVQRIQNAKAAKSRETGSPRLEEGDVITACAQACPADAISFGDMNNDQSEVRALYNDPRSYSVLAEVGTQPAISYLVKVRNKTADRNQQEG